MTHKYFKNKKASIYIDMLTSDMTDKLVHIF